MGHGGFLMRRLENVRGEFSLTALAYNIRRATTLVGIPELIAAAGGNGREDGTQVRECRKATESDGQGQLCARIHLTRSSTV